MTSYNYIPDTLRLGLFWAEVDPSKAGTFVNARKAIIIGHPVGGSAVANIAVRCSSNDNARTLAGSGSMLQRMVASFKLNNAFDELWVLPIAEPVAGVKAAGTIQVTAAATGAGTLSLYVAGQRLQIGIVAGDTANVIAGKINTAINAATDLPVTSAVATDTVTATCRWKGETGNDIDIRVNYYGTLGNEALPAGVALTITAMTGGTGAPDVSTAIANLGDAEFETIIMPWTDTATLNAFDTEMQDADGGRWAWDRQLFGHVYSARSGTTSALGTFGNVRNGPHQSTWGYYGSPTPLWERAAAWGARAHRALMNDPARPLRTLELSGCLPASPALQFSMAEKNALLFDGISVANETADGKMQIEQCITHYQRNSLGVEDNAYLKVQTLATLAYVLRSMRQRITNKYARHKLANDGTRFGPGQAIVTPNLARAELVAHYEELEYIGLVENVEAFKNNLIVERNVGNPDRLDVLYPPDLVNQLDVFAVMAQFRLQYPPTLPERAVPAV